MGVGRCIPCGFFFAVQTVGLLAQPLDAACEADPVVGGEGDIGIQHPVVAQYEKTTLPFSPKQWLQIRPQIIKRK
jgi:hypothetical protein